MLTMLETILVWLVHVACMARAILRPHREPASRIAWVVVIAVFPVVGIIAYLFLGETSIGRRRVARANAVAARMPDVAETPGTEAAEFQPDMPAHYPHLFRV